MLAGDRQLTGPTGMKQLYSLLFRGEKGKNQLHLLE
jgi:hypothetical protein